jgi:hypothetical protein
MIEPFKPAEPPFLSLLRWKLEQINADVSEVGSLAAVFASVVFKVQMHVFSTAAGS